MPDTKDSIATGRAWDDASSPAATALARRYEADWKASRGRGRRLDPLDYLPMSAGQCPGALLALLRSEMGLRREAGEAVLADEYAERYPGLASDSLVALVYEEFCLREEEGTRPEPAEYYARFPELAASLRRVLEIHDLVGSCQTTGPHPSTSPEIPYPEAGQTIGGFRLVEELGRGTFARVFLAEERQLADRPVALKVARAGSREPQTLARLQHTHIVPVHSYRTDPATGLHLLCMPYLGRATLAELLADPAVQVARDGSELNEALERLEPGRPGEPRQTEGRLALSSRPYARAIAWWGARLAEALQHAHDRGVLHRDVKPSNVLVTSDGLPMLLDFNLAWGPQTDDPDAAPELPGGTLSYMAPEHLESLSTDRPELVDARSDIYSLGVVLYEALAASRPFANPEGALTLAEALGHAADVRHAGAPRLRRDHPEVPPALEAVVALCLEPDPARRYASAADLAADLQAVADDGPLKFAREPQPSRGLRWMRRRRRPLLAIAATFLAASLASAALLDLRHARLRRSQYAEQLLADARAAFDREEYDLAVAHAGTAAQLFRGMPERANRWGESRELASLAGQMQEARTKADRFFEEAGALRYRLLAGRDGVPDAASRSLMAAIEPFYVLRNAAWPTLSGTMFLDEARRDRLIHEAEELLFLWVIGQDGRRDRVERDRLGLEICDHALAFAEEPGPWRALRARYTPGLSVGSLGSVAADPPREATSTWTGLKWALLANLEGRLDLSISLLEQVVRREPGHRWAHFPLASLYEKIGDDALALRHYDVAISINPEVPWIRIARARIAGRHREWDSALTDLRQALDSARGYDLAEVEARRELGIVRQANGDFPAARAAYRAILESTSATSRHQDVLLRLARLGLDAGDESRASAILDGLKDAESLEAPERLARARLALRLNRAREAEADLTLLIDETPKAETSSGEQDALLGLRASARFRLGRVEDALADARDAFRLGGQPAQERLRDRLLLATNRAVELRLDDPEEVAMWPFAGPALAHEIRATIERLGADGAPPLPALLTRAVLLSVLGDPTATTEAGRAASMRPDSVAPLLVGARVRRRLGDHRGALADVEAGLAIEPDSPKLLAIRGVLRGDAGDLEASLRDLDRASRRGEEGRVHAPRARALLGLDRTRLAVDAWTRALEYDASNGESARGRAIAEIRLGRWDQALADLEIAAEATDDPRSLALIGLTYASILPHRPDGLARCLTLARRSVLSSSLGGNANR